MKTICVAVYYAKLTSSRKQFIMSLHDSHPAKKLLIRMDAGERPSVKEVILGCVNESG